MAQRAVCIVSEELTTVPQTLQVKGLDTGAHNINNKGRGVGVSDGGIEGGERNDNFTMGTAPGAPSAMEEVLTLSILDRSKQEAEEKHDHC
jgi:hypothetical protein